jgi:hypothetical protein
MGVSGKRRWSLRPFIRRGDDRFPASDSEPGTKTREETPAGDMPGTFKCIYIIYQKVKGYIQYFGPVTILPSVT